MAILYDKARSVAAFLVILLSGHVLVVQSQTYQAPTNEEWDAIYRVIFPKVSDSFDARTQEYAMDLRIAPSFRAPSQLSIVKFRTGDLVITRYDVKNRELPIFEQLIALPDYRADPDYAVLAKSLAVEKRSPANVSSIIGHLRSFFNNTGFRTEKNFSLDGVFYEVWYEDTGSKFYFGQSGEEKYDPKESKRITNIRKVMESSEK